MLTIRLLISLLYLFIYLSLFRLLKPNGYFSFIVPKSITFVDSWKRIRESILNKTTLLETYDVGKAFEGVGLEQVILICKNTSDQSNITKTFQDFKNTNNISQSYFTKYNIILNSITPKVLNIITSLQKNTNKLCEIAEFPRGTNISGKDRTSIKSENCVLYLGGNNISQFRIKDGGLRKPNQFVDKNLIKEKQKSKLSSVNKKIIYQNIMSSKARIVAALDSQNYYTGDTVNNLILNTNEYSYEYILAYLNSPLATFYLKYFIINNGTLTVHLDKPYIGSLPIKKINESKNLKIKKLVDSLNKSYDYKIHKELNSIIYDIYNLDSVDANYIETDLGIGY